MGYKYEMHTHTKMASLCSSFTAEQIVDTYLGNGYAGVFITDHFFNGNTSVARIGEWEKRVREFYSAYEKVKEVGDKKGLQVFFGLEYTCLHKYGDIDSTAGTDFLVYGIDLDWLIKYGEDVDKVGANEYLNRMRASGAMIFQAHPFRLEHSYMDHISLFPDCVDGVEVLNSSPNTMGIANNLALAYAQQYNLLQIYGSDNHGTREILTGIEIERKAQNLQDILECLTSNNYTCFTMKNKFYK